MKTSHQIHRGELTPKRKKRKAQRTPHRHVYYGGKCLCGAERRTRRKPITVWVTLSFTRILWGIYCAHATKAAAIKCNRCGGKGTPTRFTEEVTR